MTRYVLARGISECAVSARYENAARPEEKRWQGWVDDQMGRIEATLALFDAKPPEPSGRLTIADIALAAALGYLDFRFSDFGWREKAPRLVPWYEAVIARPSLAATRPE
jgi:glutathione S-transferase